VIEYKCSGCGLILYRVYAEGPRKGGRECYEYKLFEEVYDVSSGSYIRRRCNYVLSPVAVAQIYGKCPRCGKPLEPPVFSNYKERVVVR
jgi:DNA-directed RNA polymerase subunit RPC12/RpoP